MRPMNKLDRKTRAQILHLLCEGQSIRAVKVRSKREASILAGLPKDELEIAKALSIPPRMVEYLLSRPGWIPRL